MEKGLNKIADIIDDMSIGVLVGISERDFLYGYVRALVDSEMVDLENPPVLDKNKKHNIYIVLERLVKKEDAIKYLEIFLNTPFEGDRHVRRVNMLNEVK